jgi:PAS domain S-box-containing protein
MTHTAEFHAADSAILYKENQYNRLMNSCEPSSGGNLAGKIFYIFLPMVFLISLIMGVIWWVYAKGEETRLLARTESALELADNFITWEFGIAASDLSLLADNLTLKRYLDGGDDEVLRGVNKEYEVFLKGKQDYLDVTYLDPVGVEEVKVYRRGKKVASTIFSKVVSLAMKEYFYMTLPLKRGDIYVSPFFLETIGEGNNAKRLPAVYLGVPVFDGKGLRRGVILIKYLARRLFNKISSVLEAAPGVGMLVDKKGRWLIAPTAGKKGGLPAGREKSFAEWFPSTWDKIKRRKRGTITSEEGEFVFRTVYPFLAARTRFMEIRYPGRSDKTSNDELKFLRLMFISYLGNKRGLFPFVDANTNTNKFGIEVYILLVLLAAAASFFLARASRERAIAAIRTRDRERYIQSVFQNTAEGIITINHEGIVETFNPAAERIFGYQVDEIVGRNVSLLMPEGDRKRHEKYTRDSEINAPRIVNRARELEGQRKDGSRFPIELNVAPMDVGGMRKFVGVMHDITERNKAAKALREIQDRLTAAIENMSGGFVMCDSKNRIVLYNRHFRALYHNSLQYIQAGASYGDFILAGAKAGEYPDALGRTDDWARERMNRGRGIRAVSFNQRLAGNRWVRVSVGRMPDGGWVEVHADITKIREAREAAEAANRAKSDFLSSMSHELRTPMNAILGFGQMLRVNSKESLTQTQAACVNHILKSGDHLLVLINEVLDFAKAEAGKMTVYMENVVPREVFEECLPLVEDMALKREVSIVIPEPGVEKRAVRADYTRLKQVLLNLLSNAVKYNRRGGEVRLSCAIRPGGVFRISRTDDGPGITKEKQSQLFEPFSRLGAENSDIEGTGIGLTLTRKLMGLMEGSIGFESEEGKGTTFWIELALAGDGGEEAAAKAAPPAKAPEDGDGDGDGDGGFSATILCVDDNQANVQLIKMLVERIAGFELICAGNAEDGLEMAATRKPDVILMDINLPGMDGFKALKRLRANPETAAIPVIALTAAATAKDVQKGRKAGFVDYITKPIHIDSILESIKKALGGANE